MKKASQSKKGTAEKYSFQRQERRKATMKRGAKRARTRMMLKLIAKFLR